jgi:hypothetical protein
MRPLLMIWRKARWELGRSSYAPAEVLAIEQNAGNSPIDPKAIFELSSDAGQLWPARSLPEVRPESSLRVATSSIKPRVGLHERRPRTGGTAVGSTDLHLGQPRPTGCQSHELGEGLVGANPGHWAIGLDRPLRPSSISPRR